MDYSKTIRYVRLVFGRTLHLRSQDFTEPIVGDALYSGVLGQYDPSPYWKMPLYAIGGRYRWFKRNGWFRRWGTARYMFFASIAWWSVTILRVIGERRRALMYHAFARGFKSTLLSLGIVTVACVIALSYGLHVYRSLTGASEGIRSSMFAILYKLLNTGSIEDIGSSTPYALIMVAAIIAGITLMSTLIGIINNAITQRLDDVRTTNAPVALRNHIAIVGYSKDAIDAVFTSDTGRNVALLSGHDRQDMQEGEAEVRMLYINDKVRTRILYRFGLVMDHATLNLIQPQYAACTMILSADDVMDSRSIGAFTQLLKASVAPIYLELMSRSAFYLLPEHDRRRHAILVTEELESLSIKLIAEFGNRACDTLYMQEADETYALWDGIPLSPALVGKRLGDCAPRESVNGIPLGLIRGGLLITDYETLLEATDRLCMIGDCVYSTSVDSIDRYNAEWQPGDTWLFKHKRVTLRQRILCAVPNKESFITARAILQDSTLIVDYYVSNDGTYVIHSDNTPSCVPPHAFAHQLLNERKDYYTRIIAFDKTVSSLSDNAWLLLLKNLNSGKLVLYCRDFWKHALVYMTMGYEVFSLGRLLRGARSVFILEHRKGGVSVAWYNYELLRRFLLYTNAPRYKSIHDDDIQDANPYWSEYPRKTDNNNCL